MEKTLTEMASDVNMDELIAGLPEFVQAKAHSKDPEQTGATIDFLLSITEFDTFKQLMLSAKMADADTAGVKLGAHDGSMLSVLGAELHIDPVVCAHARQLLEMTGPDSGIEWRPLAQKKGQWLLEEGALGGERFMRATNAFPLSVEHSVKAHCELNDPQIGQWETNWGGITILKEGTSAEGKSRFHIASVKLKLPGVIKLIPSIPKTMIMRVDIEPDMPRPGCTMAIMTPWNMKNDAPETGSLSMARVAIAQPGADGSTQFLNVSKFPPFMPTWAANLFMSKTIMSGLHQATERYKQLKGC